MHQAQAVFSAAVLRPSLHKPVEFTLIGEHRKRPGVYTDAGFLETGSDTAYPWTLVSTWSYIEPAGSPSGR